mgnify:FL=1
MPNFSQATIIGHAGRDAETRFTPSGDAVCEVSIAVTRKRKETETVTWWKVVVFGKSAEWAGEIKKGDVVFAAGEPVLEEWQDKDGNKRSTLKLYAQSIVGHGKWNKPVDKPVDKSNPYAQMEDDVPF